MGGVCEQLSEAWSVVGSGMFIEGEEKAEQEICFVRMAGRRCFWVIPAAAVWVSASDWRPGAGGAVDCGFGLVLEQCDMCDVCIRWRARLLDALGSEGRRCALMRVVLIESLFTR